MEATEQSVELDGKKLEAVFVETDQHVLDLTPGVHTVRIGTRNKQGDEVFSDPFTVDTAKVLSPAKIQGATLYVDEGEVTLPDFPGAPTSSRERLERMSRKPGGENLDDLEALRQLAEGTEETEDAKGDE